VGKEGNRWKGRAEIIKGRQRRGTNINCCIERTPCTGRDGGGNKEKKGRLQIPITTYHQFCVRGGLMNEEVVNAITAYHQFCVLGGLMNEEALNAITTYHQLCVLASAELAIT
jgi:hypothetical protein